jgi:polyadenylate-binding protein
MRNEGGESRGFGFVSYQTSEQASAAMHAMNGVQLGSKQIVVRLHEPKQLRQEKLAHRFGHNGHPRSASGATSPSPSEMGEYGWQSPRGHPTPLAAERQERGRRGSGSYYNAALSGTLNLPMRYDDLAALSPVVRREVLTGELSRRVKTMNIVLADDVDDIVRSLVNVSLSEVIKYIDDPNKLKDQVLSIEKNITPKDASPEKKAPEKSPSPTASASGSGDSSSLDPGAHNATASAPEHPSTPVSISATSTPPRTSSPSGSVPPVSERDRMLAAISKLESSRLTELTDLLMTLPKRERAMCLFNVEVLRAKLADAKAVLDSEDDLEGLAKPSPPATPQSKKIVARLAETPKTPDLSSRGPSATSSPLPTTPGTVSSVIAGSATYPMTSLAKLPAAEIIRLANLPSKSGFPFPKPDALIVQATDEFIDGLLDKPPQAQKQQLGDKL